MSVFKLRPYQENIINQIRNTFKRGYNSAILCCPTGSGKTVSFSHIARSAIDKGNKVMIACDRKELISQAYDKLKSYGLNPTIIAPGKRFFKNMCYVASVDTLLRRGMMPDIDVLIVDEAHKAKFDKLVSQYKGKCLIIGATATPIRKGQQKSLHEMYDTIVNPVDVVDLIGDGFLAPAITYGAEVDLESIETSKQEYDNKEMFNLYNKQVMYYGVVENYKRFGKGQTIVFNVNREHSRNMADAFNAEGIKAVHVDGSFSDFERKRILNAFQYGEYQVLCNCSILTTGYDNPKIETVIINRATLSLSLFLQMCGRGSRMCDEIGKTHFTIIDMGSNVKKHGFWEDQRTWDLVKKPKSKMEQPAPVKNCKQCEAIVHASVRICPHCQYIFPVEAKKLAEAEFVQLHKKETPPHLRKSFNQMNDIELEEYRKLKGYKHGWVYVQKQLRGKQKKLVRKL